MIRVRYYLQCLLAIASFYGTRDLAIGQSGPVLLTNLTQLTSGTVDSRIRTSLPVELEGTVLLDGWSGSFVTFAGSSHIFKIDWNQPIPLRHGDRVMLSGTSIVDETNLLIAPVAFIDNDGMHAAYEQSARVWLDPGKQPIRVRYFNGAGDKVLSVQVEGPDLPRQQIPESLLTHAVTNGVSGQIDWQPGVAFSLYEGAWGSIPNFSELTPADRGVTPNFQIDVARQREKFAIDFDGYLNIPRAGWYTFHCLSDDGSMLDVGQSTNSISVIGKTKTGEIERLAAGQLVAGRGEEFCAELEGTVSFVSVTAGTLNVELTSGRGRASVLIPWKGGGDADWLIGARVRADGLCQSVFTPEGNRVAGRLICPWREQFQLVQLPERLWTKTPTSNAQALADELKTREGPLLGHVRAQVVGEIEPGLWQLRDGAAPFFVRGAQGVSLSAATRVEAFGLCALENTNLVFQTAFFRPDNFPAVMNAPAPLPTLTTVEQVKQMTRAEATRGYPVKVRGVLTFVWPDSGFFLQDATWSIDVRLAPGAAKTTPQIGEYWEIEGETFAEFAPNIHATRATRLGMGLLPNAVHPNRGELVDGSLDTQYVEIQGVVSSAELHALSLLTRGGRLVVQLPEQTFTNAAKIEGALVRLRGCLIPGRDIATQQVKLGDFALFNASIAVDEPPPQDPFQLPLIHATDLLLFDVHASPIQRIRLGGIFLGERNGVDFLMDGSNGVRVLPKSPVKLHRAELVEVVGFPDLNGPSPILRDAVMRVTGTAGLPQPISLASDRLLDGSWDSTLVEMTATLVSLRSTDNDQILEMRSGPRLWLARVPSNAGVLPKLSLGSELRLTGIYAGQGGDRANGRDIDSFELLVPTASDVIVLREPSWWTVQHALAVVGALFAILFLALIWISVLRRKVEQRTVELKQEIEDHKRTEQELENKTKMLTHEIEERVRMEAEIERGHKQLLLTSRLAGMAEVATSVLHNVGNVMTSVNVLGSSIVDLVRNSRVSSIAKLGALLAQNKADLGRFLTEDERGQKMPDYVQKLGSHLTKEQETLLEKVKVLNESINHINEIVAMQQNYGKVSGVLETVSPDEVVEDALRMHGESLKRHDIELVRDFEKMPTITVDRHKVLQILFNLLENAKHACVQGNPPKKKVVVTLQQPHPAVVSITVADNGMGIAAENLTRIFAQGFSTRKDGHGFGLHSSILAAQDMGGSLIARSEGVGKGAVFILEIPSEPKSKPKTHGDDDRRKTVPL
jgi:signal transduction histidine kinase